MIKWEYLRDTADSRCSVEVDTFLGIQGELGWELIQVIVSPNSYEDVYIFKRPKQEAATSESFDLDSPADKGPR